MHENAINEQDKNTMEPNKTFVNVNYSSDIDKNDDNDDDDDNDDESKKSKKSSSNAAATTYWKSETKRSMSTGHKPSDTSNRDATFEIDVWKRRLALDAIVVVHEHSLSAEKVRFEEQNAAYMVEEEQLNSEREALKTTKDQLESLTEERKTEDSLVEQEIKNMEWKKREMKIEIVEESTKYLKEQINASNARTNLSTERQTKCAETKTLLETVSSTNQQRQNELTRLIHAATSRSAVVETQAGEQKKDPARHFHSRSAAFVERKSEQQEHFKITKDHVSMHLVLNEINSNIHDWSCQLHRDTKKLAESVLNSSTSFTKANAPWAAYNAEKVIVIPSCGFGDANLHDMEFLDVLTSTNGQLESAYKLFGEKRHEEEKQQGGEVPILQPDTSYSYDGTNYSFIVSSFYYLFLISY